MKIKEESRWTISKDIAYFEGYYKGKKVRAVIDSKDLKKLELYISFSIVERKYKLYVACKLYKGKINGKHKYENYYLHRILMNMQVGDKKVVDHEDGNGLNNRRNNLRICTRNQNATNQKIRINNKTGYRGVHKKGNRYVAQISFNKKMMNIGSFITPEDAARAYNKRAKELFGEFVRLNEV